MFILRLPWNLVRIQDIFNGFALIDVHQNATLSDSFEGSGLCDIGNTIMFVSFSTRGDLTPWIVQMYYFSLNEHLRATPTSDHLSTHG